ncbi:hypothetical protein ACQVR4_06220, partial [Streptococcus pyogenes]
TFSRIMLNPCIFMIILMKACQNAFIQGDRTLYNELVKYLLSGEQPNWVASPSAIINLSDIIAITKEK